MNNNDYMEFNWKRTLSDDYKSSFMIFKGITFNDIIVVCVYFLVMFMFSSLVAKELKTYYYIFNIIVGIFLTIKSSDNPGKRLYESYYYIIKKKCENITYKTVITKKDRNTIKVMGETILEQYKIILDEMQENKE